MHALPRSNVSGVLVALVVALGVTVGLLACTSGNDDSESSDAALEAAAQVALAMAAADAADTAGFHGMAEDIEAAGEISGRQVRTVGNVLVAVSAPQWDESLEHGAGDMIAALQELHEALEAGDVAAALEASEAVHGAQHHFTPEVYEWIAAQQLDTDADGAILVTGLAAVDIVDAAGFHGIAEDLAEATEVNTRLAGRVHNVLVAVEVAVWPTELEGDVEAMTAALEELHEALEAENLEAAREASDAVHEAQHGFSGGWYDWLAAHHASIDHSDPMIAQAAGIKVIDVVDSFGLHGIAEELETATEVNDRLTRRVANLIAVTNGDHFGPATEIGDGLRQHLQELQAALEAGDLAAAHEAAVAAHELQHDLSHDMYAWFAANAPEAMVHTEAHTDDQDAHEHGDAETAAYLEEAPKDQVVSLVMEDFTFVPDTIEVAVGTVVEIQVENVGLAPHDFTVEHVDADVHVSRLAGDGEHVHTEGMEEADLHFAMTEAGDGLVHIKVHEAGTYEFYCTVPGHQELGMVGTLVVK